MVKPKCVPGICFRENMCVETAEGVECGSCPDGYTGDGFNCDDVDEVGMAVFLPEKHISHGDVPGYLRVHGNTVTHMWIQMFFNGSIGRRFFSVQQLDSIKLYRRQQRSSYGFDIQHLDVCRKETHLSLVCFHFPDWNSRNASKVETNSIKSVKQMFKDVKQDIQRIRVARPPLRSVNLTPASLE